MNTSLHIALLVWKFPDPTGSFTYLRAAKLAEMGCRVSFFYWERGVADFDHLAQVKQLLSMKNVQVVGRMPALMNIPSMLTELLQGMFKSQNSFLQAIRYVREALHSGYSFRKSISLLSSYYPVIFAQPDIIHIESSFLGRGRRDAYRAAKKTVVVSLRGTDIVERTSSDPSWQQYFTEISQYPNLFFHCVSEFVYAKAIANGLPAEKLKVIRQGIDICNNYPLLSDLDVACVQQDDLVITARFSPVKGVDLAIQAVTILHTHGFLRRLWIIGYGPEEDTLKKMVQEAGLQNWVTFLGEKPNHWVRTFLHHCRNKCIYLQPSRSEALSQSILEAMAASLPVVAARIGGIPEIISHGKNGLLHIPESPEDIAEKIEILIKNPAYKREIAEAGFQTALQNYSVEKEAKEFINFYNSLL